MLNEDGLNKLGWRMRQGCPCGEGHRLACCEFVSALVHQAVEDERERCAQIAENVKGITEGSEAYHAKKHAAAVIRLGPGKS